MARAGAGLHSSVLLARLQPATVSLPATRVQRIVGQLSGTITDGGHNLVQTQINCGFVDGVNGTIVGQDPLLGPLRNNGGPTLTHALLPGSPAINAGDTT